MNKNQLSGKGYLRTMLDAFPSSVLIVDRDLKIHDANRAFMEQIDKEPNFHLRILCGDLLRCIHARQSDGGCGTTEYCQDCVLRQTVEEVAGGSRTFRRLSVMQIEQQDKVQKVWLLVTGALFEYKRQELVILTLEDITEIIELRRIIPICSYCKKVRDDKNFWQEVEEYLHKHSVVQFTHGICPECMEKHYPD